MCKSKFPRFSTIQCDTTNNSFCNLKDTSYLAYLIFQAFQEHSNTSFQKKQFIKNYNVVSETVLYCYIRNRDKANWKKPAFYVKLVLATCFFFKSKKAILFPVICFASLPLVANVLRFLRLSLSQKRTLCNADNINQGVRACTHSLLQIRIMCY